MSLPSTEAAADTVFSTIAMSSITEVGATAITATFAYRASEPFSVRASFAVPGAPVVHWILARDLLREGVALPSGLGDVRITPQNGGFLLELRSDNGRAVLVGRIHPLLTFVEQVYTLVPTGAESQHFSMNAELRRLLDVPMDTDGTALTPPR